MEYNISVYVLGEKMEIVKTIDQTCLVYTKEGKLTLSFGGPVEYWFQTLAEDFTRRPLNEWFCLDMRGRNYGTSPNGVYAKASDIRRILLENVCKSPASIGARSPAPLRRL